MLDEDLAALYEVAVKVLNQAVRRNVERFPPDFMFQLTAEEATGRGRHRKYPPYVFTEQGVAMLSGVLRRRRASCLLRRVCTRKMSRIFTGRDR